MKNKLIVLTGPTAVGKSELSILLAKRINAEIISADSMQVYKGMDIGTAKISSEEMDGVVHHMLDFLEPSIDYNVFSFKKMATPIIKDILSQNKIPLIVGGTGFYIQSIAYDIAFEKSDEEYRNYLYEISKKDGIDGLYQELLEIDRDYALNHAKGNKKRIIRGLEFFKSNGYTLSEHNKKENNKQSPYDLKYFVLNKNRETLYKDINDRVDLMIKMGLLDEAKDIFYDKNRASTAAKAIGYRELIEYFDGLISFDEAIEKIKKNTRHFAKRQLTWFRREKDVIWVNKDEYKDTNEILEFLVNNINDTGDENE